MRPINQPLVADEDLVASLLLQPDDDDEDYRDLETRGRCDNEKQHHVCAALALDSGEQQPSAMYAQNGDALDGGGGPAEPLLAAPLKRRRSEDGERTKKARAAAEVQRGCESDGGLPSSGTAQSTTVPHHHHHHHHHKKAAPVGADEDHQPKCRDVHGVCTLEEGSLKLKISLHRPHAVTPDVLSATPTGKPPSGDKVAHSSPPRSPLAKSEEECALSGTTVPITHSPIAHPILSNADNTVQKVADSDSDQKCDVAALRLSPVSPFLVRKVELPKAPSSQGGALELTKDPLISVVYDTSPAIMGNDIQVDKQALCGLQLRNTLNVPAPNTAVSTPAATTTSKAHHSDSDRLPSIKAPGNHASPKELSLDICARESNSVGGRSRKSTKPGHYVAYHAPHNRRRLIQDPSKLRGKMRSPIEFPALTQPLEGRQSIQSFHHVNMSVGQNGGRGFVNHNSIMDHPSVHARMFPPPGASPPRLASLLTSNKPQGLSATKQPVVQCKAGTSSDVHQPLDLSKAVSKPALPKMPCLAEAMRDYVPPIILFYKRPRSRQRLEGIIVKLWAKQNIPVRGRPRP